MTVVRVDVTTPPVWLLVLLLACWPVPMVSVTVSTTVSVMTAQTVGADGVPGRPGVPGVLLGVPVVSGDPGVGVAVGGTSVDGTPVAVVLSLPEGVAGTPGVPGVPRVTVVSGVPGVGVTVGGTTTMVVVSLPEGVSGVPGMLGVGVLVGGGTSTVRVVVSLP